jgi:hypothetical protein
MTLARRRKRRRRRRRKRRRGRRRRDICWTLLCPSQSRIYIYVCIYNICEYISSISTYLP